MKRVCCALAVFLGTSLLHASSALSGHIVAIDAGHGTIDYHGNVINSGKMTRDMMFIEHRLNFQIALKIGKMIEDAGGTVVYTRTLHDYWRQASSITEDNKSRALLANELKAEAFIAIHCDWDPRARIRGMTTYYKTPESRRLGEAIHKKLIKNLKASDRRLKKDSFTVLDKAAMPAILVETGFLSNRAEAWKLSTAAYQKKIAESITAGLNSYFSN